MSCGNVLTTYKYDNKGYLTKLIEGSTTKTYAYDNLGNLVINNGIPLNYDGQLLREYGSTVINYNGMYPINEVVNGTVTKTYDWLGSKLVGITSNKSYAFDYNARGLRERKVVKNASSIEKEMLYFYDSSDRLILESRYNCSPSGQKSKYVI